MSYFTWRPRLLGLLFIPCLAAEARSAEFSPPIAIVGVKIVTGTGAVIESGTILIQDQRIVAVGSDVAIPPGADRIDATGMIAYPGFIDALSHAGISEKERTKEERERAEDAALDARERAFPETHSASRRGIRPELRAIDLYTPDEKHRETHRAQGFTTALIAPRDGIFGGTSDLLSLSGLPLRQSILSTEVAQHASFAVGEPGEYPRSLLGVFAQFRQALLDARWHAKMQKYAERHPGEGATVPTDAALDALQPILARSKRVFFEANTENEIRRSLDLAAEFKLDVVLTGGKEAWKVADRLKAEHVPVILSLKFDQEPEYGKEKDKPEAKKPETPPSDKPAEEKETKETKEEKVYEPLTLRKEQRRLWDEQVGNAKRLHEAGVPFALSTRRFKSVDEFTAMGALLLKSGLPEDALVRALTAGAAEIVGAKDRLGTIEPGRLAHLTLWTKPLSDKTRKVRFAFVDGKKFELEAEDEKGKAKKDAADAAKSDKPKEDEPKSETAAAPDAEVDKGPKWAIETLADRKPKTKTGGNVLIRNATILPVVGPTIQGGSILIRGGKIAAIGTDLAASETMTVIDAHGGYVMPGIVDPHSHLGIDGVNEGPLAISAEVRIADLIDPHDAAIYRALAGGVTTHHAMHGSANPIGGQNVTFKLKYERPVAEMLIPEAARTIKFALGENVTQANFFDNYGKRYPNTRMGVEAAIRGAFEAAKQYTLERETYERESKSGKDLPPPRRDLRLESLSDVLAGKMFIHSHCYRSEEILRLLAVTEEYGVRVNTLHHVLEGYRIADEIARHGAGASTFANDWAYKVEAYQAIPHNAALMTERGVTTSLNSDSAGTIRYLNQEAAKCVRWGSMSENEALKLITLHPAMQLGIDGRLGSLEVGKDGDVALFNGHPLNTFSRCVMTFIDGEVYFEDARPEQAETLAEWKPPTPITAGPIPTTPHRAYAITNATIHPISGPVIEKGTIVIVDDKILEVGATATIPPGAGIIDATGRHVYPGLIDAGSILGLSEIDSLRPTRDFNEIGTFNPHIKTSSAVHPHSEHIAIARAAGITTTLVKPSGNRIYGQSSVVHLDGWTTPEMLLVDRFGLHMNVPSLPVRLPEDKEEKKKRTDEHKKATKDLEVYITKAKLYADAKDAAKSDPTMTFEIDLPFEAMIPFVRGEKPVILDAASYKGMLDAIEFAEKHKLKPILWGAQEAWKIAAMLKEKDIAVILATVQSYPRGEFEPWDSVYRCAAELDRAGVRFCFASDTAPGAYDLGTMVGMAVAHGLSREKAERAVTLGAAEILGIADRVGSIEPGKSADLIVLNESPIQTVSQISHMFIAGRPIELTNLHTQNYEKFRNRPKPKLPPVPELRGPRSLSAK